MDTRTENIRRLSADLLEKEEVERIIGFTQGSIPMSTTPISIVSKQDVDKLIFNSFCNLNLANYVRQSKVKTAVVAKGCDSRNIVTHIVENQLQRENIVIIGVPCTGMVDRRKITAMFEDEIIDCHEKDGKLIIKSNLKEEILQKEDVLRDNCIYCTHKNPVIFNFMTEDPVKEQQLSNPFPDVDKIEAMTPEDKWAHFQNLTENCIRCYACRNACPLCYCPTCFVDESDPQWIGKGQNKTDITSFHVLRAFHCAGRCTDCGACVEACPMNINVRDFTRKLNKDVMDLFGWEAGLDLTKRPPLDTYSPDDPNDFIK